jgi:hypothetical protein
LSERKDFAGIIYAHQLRITIGQMVEDLELIARATSGPFSARWAGGGMHPGAGRFVAGRAVLPESERE